MQLVTYDMVVLQLSSDGHQTDAIRLFCMTPEVGAATSTEVMIFGSLNVEQLPTCSGVQDAPVFRRQGISSTLPEALGRCM